MKLLFIKKGFIYFYFFILISLHSFIYSDATINYNYAKLDKYKSYQLYSSSYNYFFLDIASFEGEDYLYFKLEINYGTFSYDYMNYEIYSSIPPNPSTPKKVQYCSRDYNYDSYYERYIYYYYYYKIPKPKNGYIIILPPTFSTTSGNAFIINLKNNNFECKGITISNYYLDGETGLYKNCYTKCKKCYEGGTINNNNCDECKEGNILLNEPLGYEKNCFSKCPYYYYFIENNKPEKYTCTSSKSCPPNYKLITQKNKCIDECKNDNDNKYIFECISGCDSRCVEKCPTDLKTDYEEKKCLISCTVNKFEYMNTCLTDCPSWTYKIYTDRNRCFEKLPENYYLDSTTGIYKICHENCKRCSSYGDNNNNNCDECKNGFIFLNEPLIKEKNCVLKCNGYYYFDGRNKYTCASSCPITYKKIIPKKKCIDKCINDIDGKYIFEYNNECVEKCPFNVKIDYEDKKCLESCYDYKFEYMNTCLTNCPEETYKIFTDRYRCTKILPINFFYLEEETQIYKPCFESCLKCYGEGNIINNNCIKCKKDFIPLNEPYKDKNCFSCKYDYYINDEGSYFCTENSNCPTKYNKLIKEQKKCIKKCIKDNTYKYNYNNICLQNCPNNTYYTNENKICYDNSYPKELAAENEIIYSRECLTSGECKDMNYTVEIGNVTIQITNSK